MKRLKEVRKKSRTMGRIFVGRNGRKGKEGSMCNTNMRERRTYRRKEGGEEGSEKVGKECREVRNKSRKE